MRYTLQLAGVVAVEVTGGPEIPFHPGREGNIILEEQELRPRMSVTCALQSTLSWRNMRKVNYAPYTNLTLLIDLRMLKGLLQYDGCFSILYLED
uniref:Uncharacterized protein n=1 Tax=Kalanchoe fedtschenkoi TaxID=63787 RepID=A0A7N0UKT5_KALFE